MHRRSDDSGFGLVEIVIALFLLGIIAVAILPVMINGIRYSSEQSTVATATRQLSALVDQARENATSCAGLAALAGGRIFPDGAGHNFTTTTVAGACTPGDTSRLTITAKQGMTTLASVDALIFIPAP
ncbi:prepilin-type N-terminal cleavage/methylation domain-containing protein [Microbacterium terrisoli]|uniref:prepilin-type N-terminal cleavage/methylation domain-containing protein n=1 Tax=Microbacterium terrisoli TaxID=3242192 RepID=UPI0028047D61|nr:prepilin-type N-terminal cleavage/methylation domain-containing protein [Microbacterium protaetiae]